MKCENLKKGEKNMLSIHNPTGCMKSFENTTICFSMVDLFCSNTDSKFFLHFSQLYDI